MFRCKFTDGQIGKLFKLLQCCESVSSNFGVKRSKMTSIELHFWKIHGHKFNQPHTLSSQRQMRKMPEQGNKKKRGGGGVKDEIAEERTKS